MSDEKQMTIIGITGIVVLICSVVYMELDEPYKSCKYEFITSRQAYKLTTDTGERGFMEHGEDYSYFSSLDEAKTVCAMFKERI